MADTVMELKAVTWLSQVERSKGITIVYFWAPWCKHCKKFSATYEEVAAEMTGKARFAKLNCDEHTSVVTQCNVDGTPTIVVYRDGKEVDRIIGGREKKELKQIINKHIPK
jgi:thioredoxin 1